MIKVKVFPRSGREEVVKVSEGEYKVYLKKPAVDGKANVELVQLLKNYLKRPVRIKSGFSSRNKILEGL